VPVRRVDPVDLAQQCAKYVLACAVSRVMQSMYFGYITSRNHSMESFDSAHTAGMNLPKHRPATYCASFSIGVHP
jgi:hypothetical protein